MMYHINPNGEQFDILDEAGNVVTVGRLWYEKKTDKNWIKLPKNNPTGRKYVAFADVDKEFQQKTEGPRVFASNWKERLTEEEKAKLAEAEKTVEELKKLALSRPVVKVDPNSVEGLEAQIEKLKAKLEAKKAQQ